MSKDLEARRDAFKQQSKLLVNLPEKNKDDVFANQNLHKPSTIDVASDDVNWYSIDKQRPGHAPGYIAKVAAADPDAVAALAATLTILANGNNSNIVLAWFEFPGKISGASQSKKTKLSNDRDVSQSQEPRLSVDGEASRFKKLRLSHSVNASLPPPADVHSHLGQERCANCQNAGHTLAQCPKAPYKIGNTGGCPLRNTKLHSLDNCDRYAGRDLPSLRDDEVLALYKVQVLGRPKMSAIGSERFFWLDCVAEAAKRKLIGKDLNRPAGLDLPWTHEYTRKVAALESNDPQLKGNPTPSELCSTKHPVQFWGLLPADLFWAKKTVGAVTADHAQGKLEHLRWAPRTKSKLKAVTGGPLGSSVPPRGGNPVTLTEKGPDLTENDKRSIKIDLRLELWTSGLLNLNGTIFLSEEVMA
ncbi:hypothetical protein B0T18DRAFT_448997 [Schizothecium vesticola]|uniref:Uncharacterized protein n=1 Tax=Schizothecium vesticola TaxID=314040 RepID=A0AA40EJ75_9PEZI|nr:hypothetical protein B0T18DRAFT_448997 [Schizothecium vesticola]